MDSAFVHELTTLLAALQRAEEFFRNRSMYLTPEEQKPHSDAYSKAWGICETARQLITTITFKDL